MPEGGAPGGVNSAMLASMEHSKGSPAAGAGLPSNQGIDAPVGSTVMDDKLKQDLTQNLASAAIEPVTFRGSLGDDALSTAFSGNMVPGNELYFDTFTTNVGMGDVSAASGFGLPKGTNTKEGGSSFGNISDAASRG